MSLPDTVFIFVLALIIFGPKKLPEIGRQLGKLVGEFRRASNEFKFQIEEELRQAELNDRQTIAAPTKELATSSSASTTAASPIDLEAASPSNLPYPEETMPAGQYPNIDNLDRTGLEDLNRKLAEPAPEADKNQSDALADAPPIAPAIQPATGIEPRTTTPHTPWEPGAIESTENIPSVAGSQETASVSSASSPANAAASHNHVSTEPTPDPAVADVSHG